MNYHELVASNWGFISTEAQQKIRNARILLAGCGLGSTIAVLAARTGFTNFILADGDRVELRNLNRQSFRLEHLGGNKAVLTAGLIREINPQANVDIFPHFITTSEEINALVTKADLVVNMVDPSPVLYQLNNVACMQGKPALSPLNIGFGGAILVFCSTSSTLDEMLTRMDGVKSDEFFLQLVETLIPFLPGYLQEHVAIKERVLEGNVALPQLGIAAYATAALTVTTMIKLTLGVSVKTAPTPITMDSWEPTKDYCGQNDGSRDV